MPLTARPAIDYEVPLTARALWGLLAGETRCAPPHWILRQPHRCEPTPKRWLWRRDNQDASWEISSMRRSSGDNDIAFPTTTPRYTMACSREGSRLVGSLLRRQLPLRAAPPCARRFTSTSKVDDLSELDSNSSFLTPPPDEAAAKSFDTKQRSDCGKQLPGNR